MVAEDDDNIDLAKVNYLNVLNNNEIKKTSEDTIREYGVGTCGPRASYGTTDVHFELEKNLAEFLHKEDCLVYCYGFVAISSSIAAFCKKSDVVFIDERANLPIEQGLDDARSKVVKFAHNDPEDFKTKVEKETKKTRKFLVVEGIQKFSGLAKSFHQFLEEECRFKVESHPEAPFKLIRIGPKVDETKVHQYCKEKGVHFIQNDEGLVINLNVRLLDEKEKLERVYEVLKGASEFIA
ncbi:unnamed protein product [Tenebrio molitor]|nr:unnamed protein product [Tenebrio molitor]